MIRLFRIALICENCCGMLGQMRAQVTFLDCSYNFTHVNLISTPMGVDYVVIGFDMEVQPLLTHNAV